MGLLSTRGGAYLALDDSIDSAVAGVYLLSYRDYIESVFEQSHDLGVSHDLVAVATSTYVGVVVFA